ncbi:hypothetical protein OE88DRAFT_67338 [Heliocybe sulcata]|uniref:F-box domain-containing protein n=1 Tax=Heliocybe sulcata TaxID=5364 RepID=A0A5C3NG63_9AGAM|nr:hypothetical protein OE88DRAFT_67338 [Heliocybe sulcata]
MLPLHGRDHPISRLPVELRAEVFIRWAEEDKDGPWLASLVCKSWRKEVLSCPRAWSFIQLDLEDKKAHLMRAPLIDDPEWCIEEDSEEAHGRSNSRPLELWLERSANCVLSVSLILGRVCPSVLIIHATLAKFAVVMDRVANIEVGLESRMVADSLLDMFWELAPELRCLTIKCGQSFRHRCNPWEVEDVIIPSIPKVIKKSPALRGLFLHDCMLPAQGSIAYGHLRELSLVSVNCSVGIFLISISACCRLEILSIESCQFHSLPSDPVDAHKLVITMPKLTSLEFTGSGQVLRYIHAPMLETLRAGWDDPYCIVEAQIEGSLSEEDENTIMDYYRDITVARGLALVEFCKRSPSIITMRLQHARIREDALISCLRLTPHLRSLELKGSFIGGEAFRALSVHLIDGKVSLCQHLKTLALESCHKVTGLMLRKFVHARDDSCRLDRVSIAKCEKISEEHIHAIRGFCRKLKIEFVPWEQEDPENYPAEENGDQEG